MIQDIEGATAEPMRRGHMAVLSGAVAAVSLALLVALAVPPSGVSIVEPSAAPSASQAPTMTIVSGSAGFVAGSGRVTWDQVLSPLESRLVCAVPRPDVWGPALVIDGVSYAVGERTGRALPPPVYVGTSPSWFRLNIYDRSGAQVLYTCLQTDALAPRIDLSNIAP